jgi:hypothetical protein
MVKKFTTSCDFSGKEVPVTFYLGEPSPESPHPIAFQNKWLVTTRGGTVPAEVMDSFSKLREISEKNRLSFEELCDYVVKELNANQTLAKDAKQASALANNKKKPAE